MSVDLHLSIVGMDEAQAAIKAKLAQCDPHMVATKVAVPVARHWRNHLQALPKNQKGYPSSGFWEDSARRVVGIAQGGTVLMSSDKLGLRQRLHGGTIAARNAKYLTIPICAEAYGTKVSDWGIDNLTLVINRASGFSFFALWLGNDEVVKKFKKVTSKTAAALKRMERMKREGRKTGVAMTEATTKAVNQFRVSGANKKPDVVIFNSKSGNGAARVERHMNLKFLFLLIKSVEQAANPNVIPPDLSEVAFEATLEATK